MTPGHELVQARLLGLPARGERPDLGHRLASFGDDQGGSLPDFAEIGAEPGLELPSPDFPRLSRAHVVIVTTLNGRCQETWERAWVLPC